MRKPLRPKIMRRFGFVAGLALVVAGCGSDAPETGPTTTTTTVAQTTTTQAPSTTTTSTVDLSTYQCGDTFPAFPADLEFNDPADVTGTSGPGPGSYPAADRQLVAHWEGDEYATFELRWPAEPHDDRFTASELSTAFPVSWPELVNGRAVAYLEVAPERSDPCRLLAIEAYGPRTDPLLDSIFFMLDALRPASELDEYLADVADRTTQAEDPDGRTAGACAVPITTVVDTWGHIPDHHRVELVRRFLGDRVAGLRASDCLTESALDTYPTSEAGYYQPPQCLFECDDGSRLVGFDGIDEGGWTAVLEFENTDGTVRRMREEYHIEGVTSEDGELHAMIVNVWSVPESWVSEADARRVIATYLDALAAEAWEVAWGFLVGEGAPQELFDRWDDPWAVDPSVGMPEVCATALCDSRYEILGTAQTQPYGRTMIVRFFSADGPVDKQIGTGMFEGHISVSHFPPEGRDGEPPPTLADRLFGGAPHGDLVVFRYDAAELIEGDGSSFVHFWPSRYLNNAALVGDVVVYDDGWGYVHAVDITETVRIPVSAEEQMHAAGAGRIGGVDYALIANADGLFAHDPATGARFQLLDRADGEFVNFASIVGDLLLVSTGPGDATWYELFDLSSGDGTPSATFTGKLEPTGAAGHAHPSPDGQRLAYIVEETLHRPTIVAVGDLSGAELGRWVVPVDRVVGPITYDGRWIIGELWGRTDGLDDPGERLIIDTETGHTHIVESHDIFLFR